MKKHECVNRRQFIAVGFCALLSPAIRALPAMVTPISGEHAWISAAISLAPLVLVLYFMQRFLRSLAPGEGMADIFLRVLGKPLGRIVLLIMALWMLFYAAYVMRAAANRFISTIFPESTPAGYIPITGALALMTGLGQFKVLCRFSGITRPVLFSVMLLALLFALPGLSPNTFSLPTAGDVLPIICGTVPVVNAISVMTYLSFLEGYIKSDRFKARSFIGSLSLTIALMTLLCFTTVGSFGPTLIGSVNHPFFVMIRNIRVFNSIERIEALVIAMWFFTDFILVSALMHASTTVISAVLGIKIDRLEGKLLSLRSGRWLIWLCAGAATVCALLLAPTTLELTRLASFTIPRLNLIFALGVFPAVFIIGMLRRRI